MTAFLEEQYKQKFKDKINSITRDFARSFKLEQQQNKKNSDNIQHDNEIITTLNNTKEVTYPVEPSGSSWSSAGPGII